MLLREQAGPLPAVGAPASWLFQAISSPHRHQASLKDQGHREGGSFSVFLLFVCRPLFGVPHSPSDEENKAGLVGSGEIMVFLLVIKELMRTLRWEWIGMKGVWRILRWEWRGKVFSVGNRRVDESFEMGWRGDEKVFGEF